MTQEDKDLLFKDLCARLPYGVKISIPELWTSEKKIEVLSEIFKGDDGDFRCNDSGMLIKHVKPYLFPLSSMTDEQKEELKQMEVSVNVYGTICFDSYDGFGDVIITTHDKSMQVTEWFNKNHFDYRGLIEKGLATDATGLNIY